MAPSPTKAARTKPAPAKARASPITKRRKTIATERLSKRATRSRAAAASAKRTESPLTKEMRLSRKAMEKEVINRAAELVLAEQNRSVTPGGRATFGAVRKIVERYENDFDFVTRDKINHAVRDLKKARAAEAELRSRYVLPASVEGDTSKKPARLVFDLPVSETAGSRPSPSDESDAVSSLTMPNGLDADGDNNKNEKLPQFVNRKKGGGQKGVTKASRAEKKRKKSDAMELAALEYDNMRTKLGRLPQGSLNKICKDHESKFGLSPGTIKPDMIRKRVYSSNPSGFNPANTSPTLQVEPIIVEFCTKMALIGQPYNRDLIISLAQDLISGNKYGEYVNRWKQAHSHFKGPMSGDVVTLTPAWYEGFMRRNNDVLKRARVFAKHDQRRRWCNYDNFVQMYECIYQAFVDARIARRLPDEEVSFRDINGNPVSEGDDAALGMKVDIEVTHPDHLIFVDECGINTNQKSDGNIGGQLVVVPKGLETGITSSITDLHATVLGFTAATGEPVMCAIILKSDGKPEDLPIAWIQGIDPTVESIPKTEGMTNKEWIAKNLGPDKAMKGGPTCQFRGKEIPCFVTCSPKASITSEILAQMLAAIDRAEVFERSPHGPVPFLLLDGHHSRLELPFLKYINDKDHEWVVCIGVPYATHLWQVADSTEQNGCFKMGVVRVKREFIAVKKDKNFAMTDVVPIVCRAWYDSFANVANNKKAIARRGWNPCNYVLLLHPDILITKGQGEEAGVCVVLQATGDKEQQDAGTKSTGSTASLSSVAAKQPARPEELSLGGASVMASLQSILEDAERAEELKQNVKKKREKEKAQSANHAALKKATRITSGSIVAEGNHKINGYVNAVAAKLDNDRDVLKKKAEAKAKALRKNECLAFHAYAKYKRGEKLKSEDLKSLLRITRDLSLNDLAVSKAKNVAQLTEWWDARKVRPSAIATLESLEDGGDTDEIVAAMETTTIGVGSNKEDENEDDNDSDDPDAFGV